MSHLRPIKEGEGGGVVIVCHVFPRDALVGVLALLLSEDDVDEEGLAGAGRGGHASAPAKPAYSPGTHQLRPSQLIAQARISSGQVSL